MVKRIIIKSNEFLEEDIRMSDFFIKIASPNDADKLLDIYSYYIKNTAISFEYGVPMVEEFKLKIKIH